MSSPAQPHDAGGKGACTRRAGLEVRGRDGVTLSDRWTGGMKTLDGFTSRGFPNLFHMGILQNGLSPNLT